MTEPTPNLPPAKDKQEKAASKSWIERLADRSTGLGSADGEAQPSESPADRRETAQLWRMAGLGLQMVGTIGLFCWMGYGVDRYMGWNHGALISMTIVGVIGSTYLLIKEGMKANK